MDFHAEDLAGNTDTASVEVFYDPPAFHPLPDEWPPGLDFYTTGIEVTQAIADWEDINLNAGLPPRTQAGRQTNAGAGVWQRHRHARSWVLTADPPSPPAR